MTVVVHAQRVSGAPELDPSGLGVSVRRADSSADVLEELAAGDVDCVVCQVDVDSGDGLQTIRAVRSRDPGLPIIAYSASNDGEIATEVTRAGATEYVSVERLGDAGATLRDHVRDLADAEAALGPVVDGSPDATLLLSGDLSVRYANPAAAAMVQGVSVDDAFVDSLHPADVSAFHAAVDDGGTVQVRLRGAGGEWATASLHVADRRADRRVQGVVVTAREAETAELDEDIVSQAVHDLRTPLATATTYLDLAHDNPERLDDVATAHDRLEELISDVRTLAAANSGVEDPDTVDLEAVASDAWETAGDADATLVLEEGLGSVTGDEKSLRRLFENLFRNACEHDASTVRVVSVAEGFAVSDDGEGIPEGDRETVFDQGFTTREDGTGYGLSIVQSVAAGHAYGVTVTESENGGAKFVFTR